MGIFWELMQENKIQQHKDQADSLEQRIEQLENDLRMTRDLLSKTLIALEDHIGADIDGYGRLGT